MLISNAWAQGAAGTGQMDILGLMPIILMFVVLYFLLIRPQLKRAKEHRTMVAALAKGDEIVTSENRARPSRCRWSDEGMSP